MSKAPAKPAPEGAAPEEGKKKGKKKLVLLGAPLLLVALLAGLWFSGILPGMLGMGGEKKEAAEHGEHGGEHGAEHGGHGEKGGHAEKAEVKPAAGAPVYAEMPEIIANLDAGPRRASFVKMKPKLELAKAADQAAVSANMPRLLDLFTTYLREMRPDELRGSAGTYRLREELIARANIVLAPARVQDVLFTEMIVQ
jgi:flagellar protein FliL